MASCITLRISSVVRGAVHVFSQHVCVKAITLNMLAPSFTLLTGVSTQGLQYVKCGTGSANPQEELQIFCKPLEKMFRVTQWQIHLGTTGFIL